MRLGMNINLATGFSGQFLKTCVDAGISEIRVTVSRETLEDLPAFCKLLPGVRAYFAFHQITETGNADPLFQEMEADGAAKMLQAYRALLSLIPSDSIGVGLPEGMWNVVRTGPSQVGFKRDRAVNLLNVIASEIRDGGHKVVMPTTFEDLLGDVWADVKCDAYDLVTMFSPQAINFRGLVNRVKKPIWHGKAGSLGGYVAPSIQARTLRLIADACKGFEYAFLWSDKANERFHWSRDGEFVLKAFQPSIKAINT